MIQNISRYKKDISMRVRILMMCKNEIDIIRYWLEYYGALFGFPNLFVVDNLSNDGTWEVLLDYAKRLGVRAMRERNYMTKSRIVTQIARSSAATYDLVIPVDTDEFIVYYDQATGEFSPDRVRPVLDTLTDPTRIYKMRYLYALDRKEEYTNPIAEMTDFSITNIGNWNKSILHANRVRFIDHGFHCEQPRCLTQFTGFQQLPNLFLAHFHTRGYRMYIDKSVKQVVGRGIDPRNVALIRQLIAQNAPGKHHMLRVVAHAEGRSRQEWESANSSKPVVSSGAIWGRIHSRFSAKEETKNE